MVTCQSGLSSVAFRQHHRGHGQIQSANIFPRQPKVIFPTRKFVVLLFPMCWSENRSDSHFGLLMEFTSVIFSSKLQEKSIEILVQSATYGDNGIRQRQPSVNRMFCIFWILRLHELPMKFAAGSQPCLSEKEKHAELETRFCRRSYKHCIHFIVTQAMCKIFQSFSTTPVLKHPNTSLLAYANSSMNVWSCMDYWQASIC